MMLRKTNTEIRNPNSELGNRNLKMTENMSCIDNCKFTLLNFKEHPCNICIRSNYAKVRLSKGKKINDAGLKPRIMKGLGDKYVKRKR